MKKWLIALFFSMISLGVFSQSSLRFEENKGQWDSKVLYMARMSNGFVFAREDGLLFVYSSPHLHNHEAKKNDSLLNMKHAFILRPEGMRKSNPQASEKMQGYSNYFIGKEKSKWQSNVSAYSMLVYKDVYEGVDWRIYSENGVFKHEFVVHRGANPESLELLYEGVDEIRIIGGELRLKLSVGELTERKPYAYQLYGEEKRQVEAAFRKTDKGIGYMLGAYDRERDLIIDPSLIFSTYSGSVADNWGFTATYDAYGNLYSGSIVIGVGYPTSTGAFCDSFGGVWDCAISKYSADGRQLLYSTYLGGTYSDMPHSMIVDGCNELIVFGTTGSHDFPTTDGAYQRFFSGGTAVTYDGSVQFPHGVDIYISRLSSDGTQLRASTYIGGSANDGLNYRERYNSNRLITYLGNDSLYANYGDGARGELITDDRNNVYVGSSTFSFDFPIVNAFQPQTGGGQDGVVFKLDYTLSTLLFSSYIGGSGDDAVFSIDTDKDYRLYITGGTVSDNFPTTPNAYNTSHNGGTTDAFLALISYDGSQLLSSSLFGSEAFDLSYFVRTDRKGFPHIFGQTKASGSTLVRNAQYNIPNSGQFIAKFTPAIDSLVFSTVFGTGDNSINISPSGFSVDVCGRIYAAGWGKFFKYLPNLPAVFGTMNMQTTPDAYQSQTDGQDFYIMSLSSDASVLDYATFFGEVSNSANAGIDHVDGGTSRFDRYGSLYQSVCASCGGSNGFPVFPADVWSTENGSTNCNAVAFKFNVHSDYAVADFDLPEYVCFPDTMRLENLGRGDNFLWLFGDGSTSTEVNPKHVYTQSGIYDITLIAYKNGACWSSDTLTKRIILLDSHTDTLESKITCPGDPIQIGITAYPQSSVNYLWQPAGGLSSATVPNPYASVQNTTTYRLIISTPQCSDTLIQTIEIEALSLELPDTVNYCSIPYDYHLPESVPSDYLISTSFRRDFSDSVNALNGIITLDTASSSWLYIHIRRGNCFGQDSIFMNYNGGFLQVNTHDTRCNNESNGSAVAITSGFTPPLFFQWSNGLSGTTLDSIGNLAVGNYNIIVSDANACSVSLDFAINSPDDLITEPEYTNNHCQNECSAYISLNPSGGVQPYNIVWNNGSLGEELSNLCSGDYIYTLTDSKGCSLTDTIRIIDTDTLKLSLNATENNCPQGCGAVITSFASGGNKPYSYLWSDGTTEQNISEACCGEYVLELTDVNNCRTQASITVTYTDLFENFSASANPEMVFDGQEVRLSSTHIAGMRYTWSPAENLTSPHSSSSMATMYQSTLFHVYVSDGYGCKAEDSVFVEVEVVNCGRPDIYVPNIFTPNGDGKNDVLFVMGEKIDNFTFEVFDRWGEKVFATSDLQEGWDGTYKGRQCDAAVYFYSLEVRCLGGKTYKEGGDITLIR